MRRVFRITFCALASTVGVAALPAIAEEHEVEAARAEEELRTGQAVVGEAAKAGPAGQATASGRAWWNSPTLVEALSLTGKQRQKMDGYLAAFRQKTREHGALLGVWFNEALTDGDWDAARGELEKLAALAGGRVRARGELKLGVLSALRDEQRKSLVERYPKLIGRPWLGAAGSTPGPGAGGPIRP